MITESQVIAEVKNTFKSYDESGLIDEITLRDVFKSEIKSFGNNIMIVTDDVVDVKNGKAQLPDDFWALKEAWRYSASHYVVKTGAEENLEKSSYWRSKVLNGGFSSYDGDNQTVSIQEEFEYKGNKAALYYNKPRILRLKSGFRSNFVSKDCKSLPQYVKRTDKNEINILGNYIQTEFSNGYIYIVYRALPTDEQGDIVIPETQHDTVYKYIKSVLEYTVARQLWLNNDDPNIANKISFLLQEKEDLRSRAMTELKAKVLDPSVWKTLRNTNRKRYQKYSRVIPKQDFRR